MKVTDVKHGYRGPKDARFDEIKKDLMELLENAKNEGVVDDGCLPYLELLNAHPNYVTSSSCYGRIHLIDLPDYTKKNTHFVWKQHRKVTSDEVWEALQKAAGTFIWFKMEPLILHVSCRDVAAADKLLKIKLAAGIKRGGIFSIAPNRVQIEVGGTYRMEAPVKKESVLITKDYFDVLVEEANKKFDKNTEMWERFGEQLTRL